MSSTPRCGVPHSCHSRRWRQSAFRIGLRRARLLSSPRAGTTTTRMTGVDVPPSGNLPLLTREGATMHPDVWQNAALLIDKPPDWTSFDVCNKLRSALRVKKVGHAGTLDPMATGLLIVCLGRATKQVDSFVAMEKEYIGVLRLGEATPSFDAMTEVTESRPWQHITDAQLANAASALTGSILQLPPMYSAVHVKGQRLYAAARRGEIVERTARPVHVSEFELTPREKGAALDARDETGVATPTPDSIAGTSASFRCSSVAGGSSHASSTTGSAAGIDIEGLLDSSMHSRSPTHDPAEQSGDRGSSSCYGKDVAFRVVCSKGTYIRSLAHDLGTSVHSAAHLVALRRTRIGQYHVDDAWTMTDFLAAAAGAKMNAKQIVSRSATC